VFIVSKTAVYNEETNGNKYDNDSDSLISTSLNKSSNTNTKPGMENMQTVLITNWTINQTVQY